MATNGIDNFDDKNLVEVKGYKKATPNLLKKALLVIGTIVVTIALMCSVKSCQANKTEVIDEDNKPGIEQPIEKPSNNGGSTTKPSGGNTTKPSGGSTNNGGSNNNGNSGNSSNNGGNNNGSNNGQNNNGASNNGSTPDKWTTEELGKDETIKVDDVEKIEDKEPDDKLTRAEKEYIQEYVDYYDISWEDAKVCYFQYGRLNLSKDSEDYVEVPNVKYGVKYVFDEDDLASIYELMNTLGMTREEAENHYVTYTAPQIGKTIATEYYVLSK